MVRSISAQTGESASGATISVDVNLVMLPATVTDRKGNFVPGLQPSNFHVFEDGIPQTIRIFQHEDVPVAVGLVVDNSSSMRTKREDVSVAALAFIDSSNSKDQMFVVNFNEHVTFGLPAGDAFSSTRSDLDQALNGVPANGMTALYDAIEAGLDHVQQSPLDRKVLIVISDGGDNASHRTLKQVLDTGGHANVLIYTIGLFDEDDTDRNPGVLKKIARETGGEAYLPEKIGELTRICKRIAEDIRNQYSIGYVPANRKYSGTYRNIRVTATGPHGEHLSVRTRSGYLASPQGEEVTTAHGKLP
jgi:VWFA-related protein